MYDKALEYAKLKGDETVIDAYCGVGTLSLFLAKKEKKVCGGEIVPEAIEDAKKNANSTVSPMPNLQPEKRKKSFRNGTKEESKPTFSSSIPLEKDATRLYWTPSFK
ncbi:MAG: hypothetical protein QJR05_03625 [Thermoanaerobacterium sp.]|nr:hypothetical protein [Thermoanaerobacterium sp.]